MELIGLELDPKWPRSGTPPAVKWCHDDDPCPYVISKNIHRRHLTKEQQAELIVKVIESTETDLAKMAKSVKQASNGRLNGSAKDPLKQAAVEEAKKHGISKRTVERAMAKNGASKPTRVAYRGKLDDCIERGMDQLENAAACLTGFYQEGGKHVVNEERKKVLRKVRIQITRLLRV